MKKLRSSLEGTWPKNLTGHAVWHDESCQMIRQVLTPVLGLVLMIVSASAKPKQFTDSRGDTLIVGQESKGIAFWITENGSSAQTGPTMSKAEAQKLGLVLRQAWDHRNKAKWKSKTYWSANHWVIFSADGGRVVAIAGDRKQAAQTAQPFIIASPVTLGAVLKELGEGAGQE